MQSCESASEAWTFRYVYDKRQKDCNTFTSINFRTHLVSVRKIYSTRNIKKKKHIFLMDTSVLREL